MSAQSAILSGMKSFDRFLKKSGFDSKTHQRKGVIWCLKNEIESGHGGLVADEMGLGKTTLMFGTILGNPVSNTLIVLPRILLEQWTSLFQQFMGHSPLVYHSSNSGFSEITLENIRNSPIVVTTYGMVGAAWRAKNELKTRGGAGSKKLIHYRLLNVGWSRVIFDEAHHMRNPKTAAFKGGMCFSKIARFNWCVTGTPIQNSTKDFYSLAEIIKIPHEMFLAPENRKTMLEKFVLKRTKKEVGIDMSTLTINTVDVHWSNPVEKQFAKELHVRMNHSGEQSFVKFDVREQMNLNLTLPTILRAKQSCITSELFKKPLFGDNSTMCELMQRASVSNDMLAVLNSKSKLDAVSNDIIRRSGNGHKKLVFCHFQGEIDSLEEMLKDVGMRCEKFDGRTPQAQREEILTNIDGETSPECLILQIQSGCEGLNLQHFSEVYFVSPHWNPAVEDQAIARCHRIGQHKDVTVFRYIMEGFVDPTDEYPLGWESLDMYCNDLQESKRSLKNYLNGVDKYPSVSKITTGKSVELVIPEKVVQVVVDSANAAVPE